MGNRAWRLAAWILALALGLYSLWSLGVLNALAARMEPAAPEETLPAQETLPTQETEPAFTAEPEQAPSPPPETSAAPEPSPEPTAAPVFAPAGLPRVDDRTAGHDLAALYAEGWSMTLPETGGRDF